MRWGGCFWGCQAPGAFMPASAACISAPPAEASRANLHLPPHPLLPSLPAPPSPGCARRLQLSPPKVSSAYNSRAAAAPACRGVLVTQQQNSDARALTAPGASRAPSPPYTSSGRRPRSRPVPGRVPPPLAGPRALSAISNNVYVPGIMTSTPPPPQLLKMVS